MHAEITTWNSSLKADKWGEILHFFQWNFHFANIYQLELLK